jgi:hypothetical protein
MVGSNLREMGLTSVLENMRVGWWAGAEPGDPLAALSGLLLRSELSARCPGLSPVLVHGTLASWADPGFTGETAAVSLTLDWADEGSIGVDIFVASGSPDGTGAKVAQHLAEAGSAVVGIAPDELWGMEPRSSVGPPFAVPEPALLAARHLPRAALEARLAYLRVVEGLPKNYVLVEGSLLDQPSASLATRADLELALHQLAKRAGDDRPAEIVKLAPGPFSAEDPTVEAVLEARRTETEEGRYQPEDWPGYPTRPRLPLRVTSPLDLAAAVAGASVVVAQSGSMMALAWALGVPHAALAPEESPASSFAAWTGDASALVEAPAALIATIDNIFARRGRPPGLKRLEATLDQSLDEAAGDLENRAAELAADGRGGATSQAALAARLHELQAVNDSLRQRLAVERLRFGERSALLERTAHTSVQSAIKAVHGQDVILRRRLEATEKEMRRLQEETAEQQAELRAIHATMTMRALAPAREFYGRLRRSAR